MASGALVTLSVTLGSAEELTRFRFCFEHLTAENEGKSPYNPGAEPWRFIPRGQRTAAEIDAALQDLQPGPERFAGLFKALAPALDGTAPLPVTLTEARESLSLASAIYYSAATGQAVDLPLAADHPTYRGWLPWTGG
jgi:predicted dehydrogenase